MFTQKTITGSIEKKDFVIIEKNCVIQQQQQQQQHYLFLSHPRLQLYDTLFKNLKFWAIL